MVTLQKLKRLSDQVEETKQISVQRDGLMARRVSVQNNIATTTDDIGKKKRQIELWAWPDPPDPNSLLPWDTRPFQAMVLRVTWISLIVFFGGAIFLIHLQDRARSGSGPTRASREAQSAAAVGVG